MSGKGFSTTKKTSKLPKTKSYYVLQNCEQYYYVSKPSLLCENWTKHPEEAAHYRTEIAAELAMYEASRNLFCCSPEIVHITQNTFWNVYK